MIFGPAISLATQHSLIKVCFSQCDKSRFLLIHVQNKIEMPLKEDIHSIVDYKFRKKMLHRKSDNCTPQSGICFTLLMLLLVCRGSPSRLAAIDLPIVPWTG